MSFSFLNMSMLRQSKRSFPYMFVTKCLSNQPDIYRRLTDSVQYLAGDRLTKQNPRTVWSTPVASPLATRDNTLLPNTNWELRSVSLFFYSVPVVFEAFYKCNVTPSFLLPVQIFVGRLEI